MKNKSRNFAKLKSRPPKKRRLFRSEIIEKTIADVSVKIQDTDLRRMFEQCLPNTLDTAPRHITAKTKVAYPIHSSRPAIFPLCGYEILQIKCGHIYDALTKKKN